MKILMNYLENECVQKSYALKAADLVLTPYRKIFGGEDQMLRVGLLQNGGYKCYETRTQSSSGWLETALYVIPAIIVAPFALIAAFAKYFFLSPEVGYMKKCDVQSSSSEKGINSQTFIVV